MKKLDEICNAADAVLIDRGDLSREVSISLLPMAVRSIVANVRLINSSLRSYVDFRFVDIRLYPKQVRDL